MLERLVAATEHARVPFMIAGSFASTAHGLPRTTQDLDVVIDPPDAGALDALTATLLNDEFYVDPDTARDALQHRTMFNAIDRSAWKVDFILRKARPFSVEEFRRRTAMTMLGVPVFVASAEDTIVAKLEWSQLSGGSERQRRDVEGILATMGADLDRKHVERWVRELGLDAEWQTVLGARL
ncbi:MAG TPA: hypothetical protein VGG28_26625 [Kofleriaceae bacterium]